jgi:5-methylthioadenosine/S-adenosylhomocysteine deaminase
MPLHDVINTLVYCARSNDVETTIIDGQLVMRDRQILTLDEERTRHEAARYGAKLFQQGVEMWRGVAPR